MQTARKTVVPADIPLDFTAKASIAVGVDGLLHWPPPAWPQAPGSWQCKHRDRRDADMENEAMATRQSSKQAKTKAEAKGDTGAANRPIAKSEDKPRRRNPPAQSRPTAAPTNRTGGTAAAARRASLNGSATGPDNPEPAHASAKPTAERADLATSSEDGSELPPASTKRAKLISLLERPEGASVAEIGQRLGWLPHTVRAAITGLRKAGREVTRSKHDHDRSVYRLARLKTTGER
jgi:hypothetical protein